MRASARALLRRRYIANLLIEGPHAFHPPRSRGYGWLEPSLRLEIGNWPGSRRAKSCALFRDGTVNRSRPQLTPMIRVATWSSAREHEHAGRWPLVEVRWGYLRRGSGRVDDYVRKLARALGAGPLIDGGARGRRAGPARRHSGRYEAFTAMLATDERRLEFSSAGFGQERMVKRLEAGLALLEEVMVPVRTRAWAECFEADLFSPRLVRNRHWRWSGARLSA